MRQWTRPAVAGLVMTVIPLGFFALWPVKLAPAYRAMFADFGTKQLPPLTALALHPAFAPLVLGFLIGGIAAGFLRPNERIFILPLIAAGGFALMMTTVIAMYLPIFGLANAISE